MTASSIGRKPQSLERPNGDLLDTLAEEEERVFQKHWPAGKPSGEGVPYFDEVMQMRLMRLRWKLRVETDGEVVWLVSKLAGVVVVFGVAWESFVR